MSGSSNLNSFRDRRQVVVQLVSCGGVAARTCSRLHAAFLCNCRLASSLAVWMLPSMFVIYLIYQSIKVASQRSGSVKTAHKLNIVVMFDAVPFVNFCVHSSKSWKEMVVKDRSIYLSIYLSILFIKDLFLSFLFTLNQFKRFETFMHYLNILRAVPSNTQLDVTLIRVFLGSLSAGLFYRKMPCFLDGFLLKPRPLPPMISICPFLNGFLLKPQQIFMCGLFYVENLT